MCSCEKHKIRCILLSIVQIVSRYGNVRYGTGHRDTLTTELQNTVVSYRKSCMFYLEVRDELVGAVGGDLDVLLADVEEREEEVEELVDHVYGIARLHRLAQL
jgi:hypothetical protein